MVGGIDFDSLGEKANCLVKPLGSKGVVSLFLEFFGHDRKSLSSDTCRAIFLAKRTCMLLQQRRITAVIAQHTIGDTYSYATRHHQCMSGGAPSLARRHATESSPQRV
jgi:hypothetical protein